MKKLLVLSLILFPVSSNAQNVVANLDGSLSTSELKNYYELGNADENILYLGTDDTYLYLGIRSEKIHVASVCLANQERVLVLHSSAALGMLEYVKAEGNSWYSDEEFVWGMRDGEMDPKTLMKRENYLKEHGWIANTMSMGETGQTEFIIDRNMLTGEIVHLGAGLMPESDPEAIIPFPVETAGDCAAFSLVSGRAETEYSFSPELWHEISLP